MMTYKQINAIVTNFLDIDEMLKMVNDTFDMMLETGRTHKNARRRLLRACDKLCLTEEEWMKWFYEEEDK